MEELIENATFMVYDRCQNCQQRNNLPSKTYPDATFTLVMKTRAPRLAGRAPQGTQDPMSVDSGEPHEHGRIA